MKMESTDLPGVLRIEPRVFADARGLFFESWSARRYRKAGLPEKFVQDNISTSCRGTLRGLHLQHPYGQGKLVHVLLGEVFDVAVDVRVGSPHFGQWTGVTLNAQMPHQLYIPPGFAHGFCVTSDSALVSYKCTEYYRREMELTLAWNDAHVGVSWPIEEPVLSARDRAGLTLCEIRDRLPPFEE